MERNSDIVIMASYAPLFVNVDPGGMQWETDLIGYDTLTSYGSPSYYAQVTFSNHIGDEVLDSRLDGGGPRFFYSITRNSASGVLFLKLVNADSVPQTVDTNFAGAGGVQRDCRLISLSAKSTDETNTIWEPVKIAPVESTIKNAATSFRHVLPPYSIQVLELRVK
jgi:alpha-N-arabinofuranosidase